MVEFDLPGAHRVTYRRLNRHTWFAECSCGWACSGAHELIVNLTARHDLNAEPICDCDGCGKIGPRDDMREVAGYGDKVFCPTCREVPTDAEIEKARRLMAALLGWKYEP